MLQNWRPLSDPGSTSFVSFFFWQKEKKQKEVAILPYCYLFKVR